MSIADLYLSKATSQETFVNAVRSVGKCYHGVMVTDSEDVFELKKKLKSPFRSLSKDTDTEDTDAHNS